MGIPRLKLYIAILFGSILPVTGTVAEAKKDDDNWPTWCKIGGAVIGGVGAVAAAPFVLTAAGFTGAGIAAGSVAASAMSAATTYGAGAGAVAAAQSAGAAGIGVATKVVIGTTAAYAGSKVAEKVGPCDNDVGGDASNSGECKK
ncbi:unnamed protein product [Owenia fusiformis]|uniref:Uncharacterized protein n=1 Tax=Owenia fusiformis TaxID=6347 RepID=A0A8J1UZ92_OWEFU|nr:unnamed protein product [Owenia fusiformis]